MNEAESHAAGGAESMSGPGAPQPGPPPSPPPAGANWHSEQRFDPRRKSPVMAAVLSAFPGVGQLYIGYYVRGFLIAAVFLMTVFTAANSREPVGPVLAMFAMFFWAFNVIDAGRMAALYNHVAAGADSIRMPEDFKLPQMGGSIIGGAILLAFGLVALSNTAFNYRLDWLEDWWPVFPLALGAYLLARGVMDFTAQNQKSSKGYGFENGDSVIED